MELKSQSRRSKRVAIIFKDHEAKYRYTEETPDKSVTAKRMQRMLRVRHADMLSGT